MWSEIIKFLQNNWSTIKPALIGFVIAFILVLVFTYFPSSFFKSERLSEKLTAFFTGLIMLTGAFAVYIYYRQLESMNDQLSAIKEGLKINKEILVQNERMIKNAENTLTLSEQLQKDNKERYESERRAIIGVTDVKFSPDKESNVLFKITVVNSGETPALDLTHELYYFYADEHRKNPDWNFIRREDLKAPSRILVLQPRGEIVITLHYHNTKKLSDEVIGNLTEGRDDLVVFGRFIYNNGFKEDNFDFCVYFDFRVSQLYSVCNKDISDACFKELERMKQANRQTR